MKVPRFLIFNFFTKTYLRQIENLPFINRRFKAIVTDLLFIMAIFFPLFIIVMIPSIFLTTDNFDPLNSMRLTVGLGIIPYSIMIFVILNKDFYNGQSVAKRMLGYQIIDNKSNQIATKTQCMTRNITLILWPIEVLMVLIQPSRRLGDIIAGTKLSDKDKIEPETILQEIGQTHKSEKQGKLILYSIGFTVLFDMFALGLTMI